MVQVENTALDDDAVDEIINILGLTEFAEQYEKEQRLNLAEKANRNNS